MAPLDAGASDGVEAAAEPDSGALDNAAPPGPPMTGGTVVEFDLPSANAYPAAMIRGTELSGDLWFAQLGVPRLGRISRSGQISEVPVPSPAFGLALAKDGAIWFTERDVNKIARLREDGHVDEFPVPTPDAILGPMVSGGNDAAVWFVGLGAGAVYRASPSGVVTEFKLAGPSIRREPNGIALDIDGAIWCTTEQGELVRVRPNGELTTFALTGGAGLRGLVSGADGALWVVQNLSGQLARVTRAGMVSDWFIIPGATARPLDATVGPDASLWFTDVGASRIGRLTPGGAFTMFPLAAERQANGIVNGFDGSVWFTLAKGNRIGRLTP
jgi:virginiamycin B lyase